MKIDFDKLFLENKKKLCLTWRLLCYIKEKKNCKKLGRTVVQKGNRKWFCNH